MFTVFLDVIVDETSLRVVGNSIEVAWWLVGQELDIELLRQERSNPTYLLEAGFERLRHQTAFGHGFMDRSEQWTEVEVLPGRMSM